MLFFQQRIHLTSVCYNGRQRLLPVTNSSSMQVAKISRAQVHVMCASVDHHVLSVRDAADDRDPNLAF